MDFVSKRYGKLPSELMAQGSTFDFYVSQVAIGYEGYIHDQEKRKSNGEVLTPKLSQEKMLDMIAKAKAKSLNVSETNRKQ